MDEKNFKACGGTAIEEDSGGKFGHRSPSIIEDAPDSGGPSPKRMNFSSERLGGKLKMGLDSPIAGDWITNPC
jgi:hypothetical protein